MWGHLSSTDFVDQLDGVDIRRKKQRHLEGCGSCRDTLRALEAIRLEMTDPDAGHLDPELARVDWIALRSGVRDALLSRSVKRASIVQRWTGTALKPAAVWGLSMVLVIALVAGGSLWHYRNAHSGVAGADTVALDSTNVWLIDDVEAVDTEALGWSDTDLFSALEALDASEEDLLRELVSEALRESDGGVLQ